MGYSRIKIGSQTVVASPMPPSGVKPVVREEIPNQHQCQQKRQLQRQESAPAQIVEDQLLRAQYRRSDNGPEWLVIGVTR
jgi:hypothetical protein